MRNILLLVAIMVLVFSFISCESNTEEALTEPTLTTAEEETSTAVEPTPATSTPSEISKMSAGKIAFESSGSIHIINPDGSDEIRLTNGEKPLWSPDGEKILFHSYGEGGEGWGIINADGTDKTIIPPSEDWNARMSNIYECYQWSPTSDAFLIAIDLEGSEEGIYLVNADGSNIKCLVEDGVIRAVFSPDGKKIAYLARKGSVKEDLHLTYNLYVINVDGTNKVKLIEQDLFINYSWYNNLSWSPDGENIIYGNGSDLSIVNSAGTNDDYFGQGGYPIWTPDSKNVAYITDEGIYIAKPDGTGRKEILSRKMYNFLSWASSPDGNKFAFYGSDGVYTIVAGGSHLTRLVIADGNYLDWSPR